MGTALIYLAAISGSVLVLTVLIALIDFVWYFVKLMMERE